MLLLKCSAKSPALRQAANRWQQAEKTTSMNKIYDTYRPEGFGTVNGYLFAENPKELIEFLKKAFYAEEVNRSHPECSLHG